MPMSDVDRLDRLPTIPGRRAYFRQSDVSYFISALGPEEWIVGLVITGETVAVLTPLPDGGFELTGPGIQLSGESWLLLLARL